MFRMMITSRWSDEPKSAISNNPMDTSNDLLRGGMAEFSGVRRLGRLHDWPCVP